MVSHAGSHTSDVRGMKVWWKLVFALSCTARRARRPDKPNIILILADDLGWNEVSWLVNLEPHVMLESYICDVKAMSEEHSIVLTKERPCQMMREVHCQFSGTMRGLKLPTCRFYNIVCLFLYIC